MNSVGAGAFFNLTNFGQMYSYHVLLLPIAVVGLVAAHVLLVRRSGVVPPFEIDQRKAALTAAPHIDSDSGQPWLWLYALWYQIEPMKSSPSADIQVLLIMAVLSLAFICIPFIPGINVLPRKIPIYKLIWREHYREGLRRIGTRRPRGT